jgi:NAD(P)-dependent dehydrogenase (short-subunit alcohol dehydrogenase family)
MLRFDGKVVIVTGAGRGIGRAHALLLASRGAHVVVNDVGFVDMEGRGGTSALPASQVADEIIAAGGRALANFDDIASREGAQSVVARAIEAFGHVDALINNAGINQYISFENMTVEEFDTMMKVHAYGSFHMAQAIWSHMRARGYGRILLTTSGAASFGLAPLAHYCAAKGAVYGLMRSLAVEGEPFGIKVNGLSPSAYTRMVGDNPEIKARMESLMPPELVAPVAAYLVHESCTLNGENLHGGAGRASRTFVGETIGVTKRGLTLEDVAEHVADIMDETDYLVFKDATESSVALSRLVTAAG